MGSLAPAYSIRITKSLHQSSGRFFLACCIDHCINADNLILCMEDLGAEFVFNLESLEKVVVLSDGLKDVP